MAFFFLALPGQMCINFNVNIKLGTTTRMGKKCVIETSNEKEAKGKNRSSSTFQKEKNKKRRRRSCAVNEMILYAINAKQEEKKGYFIYIVFRLFSSGVYCFFSSFSSFNLEYTLVSSSRNKK